MDWKGMAGVCLGIVLALGGRAVGQEKDAAALPPLGWNSWDAYGLSITAAEWEENVRWFHTHLQPAGWQYVVLDEGWYLAHPERAGGKGDQGYTMDANGEFAPAPGRFPDGIAGLAAEAHGLGLKFGIHIIHGIPKAAVERNLPIAGTKLHAADAADTSDVCRWNPDNYGVKENEAGQRYYDGLLKLYAGWGVDFLKVDCVSKPYNAHEVHMLRAAIEKTGRPMVLSLSPGPTPIAEAKDVSAYANLWRVSDDVWDIWNDPKVDAGGFPESIRNQFGVLAEWMPYQSAGHWPDGDMLPIGVLGPRPGWGEARASRLTVNETQTLLTLWAMARCPLILGANLTRIAPGLEAELTNREWLAVDQQSSGNREVLREGNVVVWGAEAAGEAGSDGRQAKYLAVFNLGEETATVHLAWARLGVAGRPAQARDVWGRRDVEVGSDLSVTLPKHGSYLVRVR